jgi:hypothetical protein
MDAIFEAGAFTKRLSVTDVAFLACTKIGSRSVETGCIRMAIVLTQGAFVHVGTLSICPTPNRMTRIM